jgi:GNAT superfamily N-acetyltransferase
MGSFPATFCVGDTTLMPPSAQSLLPIDNPMVLFTTQHYRAVQLFADDAPALQAFFDANPDYFIAVSGAPAGPTEAHDEITTPPPSDFAWTAQWVMAFCDENDATVAMANVTSDLPAADVWHIGLFIVATHAFGTGLAADLHDALVGWARAQGARWMRLGVVKGNERAERFWARRGYVEMRVRDGIAMGARVNSVRVMVKPLDHNGLDDYLARVVRDRPDP